MAGGAVPPAPVRAPDPTTSLQPELDRLIAADQKIMAIKHYRTITGVGLKEAKDFVEARSRDLTALAEAQDRAAAGLQPELDRLIAANQKIMAIKHYRMVTNVGLKEAKDAVEARMAELAESAR
ncbi:MAG: ribosomal protein L7/L12 [Nannocystis sp.]|nr:ribosomal protein L7/L12 [Nannocystis sp.]